MLQRKVIGTIANRVIKRRSATAPRQDILRFMPAPRQDILRFMLAQLQLVY